MDKLQSFHFLRSLYERPTQPRSCGARIYGKSCQMGPDMDGRCRGQFECIPARKKDRWYCMRPAENGGSCLPGPRPEGTCCNRLPPCQPVANARTARAAATRWVIGFCAVLLALVYLAEGGLEAFYDPGGLSAGHSFKGRSCDNCHSTGSGLWQRALAGSGPEHANRSCLECHEIKTAPALAHNLPAGTLRSMVSEKAAAVGVAVPAPSPALRCALCHSEHKGSDFDLTAMQGERCESCHLVRHPDFARQHPQFDSFPYQRRTRLVFDHNRHFTRHFKDDRLQQAVPGDCASCHALDDAREHMRHKRFEDACADCHARDTTGERLAEPGIAFLGLPALDMETLESRGENIGSWPEGLEDQLLPPVLLRLLAMDPDLQEFVRRYADPQAPLFLDDLAEADDRTLQLVAAMARKLKLLLAEARADGPGAVTGRLAQAAGVHDAKRGARLFQGMGQAQFRSVVDRWFPKLGAEVAMLQQGAAPPTELIEPGAPGAAAGQGPGEWREESFVLSYRPAGHADDVLRAWLDLAGRLLSDGSPASRLVYRQLADSKGSGQCVKCHSADAADAGVVFNWSPVSAPGRRDGLTFFRHDPHLNQPGIDACQNCHELDAKAPYLASFEGTDPLKFESNFKALTKQACAECHTGEQAGQACAGCHYYHFVETSPARKAGSVIELSDRSRAEPVD